MNTTESKPATDRLLAEFPPVGYGDWHRLVETELKGAPFDKRMFTSTYEGITLQPIYRPEDIANLPHLGSFPGFAPFVRGSKAGGYAGQPWAISQEINCSSPSEFNHAARNSLDRGLNALNIVLDKATRNGNDPDWAQPHEVGFGGLSIATVSDLDRALDGIDLGNTWLFIRSGASAMPFAALLVALARQRKKAPACLYGCIEMDPLGVLSHEGCLPQSLEDAYREMAALLRWAAAGAPYLQTICVHSRSWHEAGGDAVQELAFTLATGVEYLRQMNRRDLDAGTVAPRMRFAVTVGSNFFMEIAKLRALRMLWARVVAAVGGGEDAQKLSLHVRTSQWNKSVLDPYNNMLRTTVEALAGILGGCDSMQVGAFDEVIRQPDDFSQRIARNSQLILQKECELGRTIDPAGGSWYVEMLTAELANRAWALFQEVEKQGGMEAALKAGFPQKTVAATALEKIKAVNRRRAPMIGVNQYANPKETPLDRPAPDAEAFYKRRVFQITSHRTNLEDSDNQLVLQKLTKVVDSKSPRMFDACADAAAAGATLGEIARAIRIVDSPGSRITPVCITRAATGFEGLRAAMDRHAAARQNARPAVFLCNMGPVADYKARADFSRGFFAVGGYNVISPEGFPAPEDAAKAFGPSKAGVAVICSTDEKYPALVPPLVQALRAQRNDVIIVLAGFPAAQVDALKKAGVDEFIHIRADALELLTAFHRRLGIEL
ncbi:MAG: methylmalonyl-CoA mutase family protein [Verrucomicrobiota bacterium]|jgi:methylmalonyl-CoA mutase